MRIANISSFDNALQTQINQVCFLTAIVVSKFFKGWTTRQIFLAHQNQCVSIPT